MKDNELRPLSEKEVIIHVPKGVGDHVRVVEAEPAALGSEIMVRVSKKRAASKVPVVGVIVK